MGQEIVLSDIYKSLSETSSCISVPLSHLSSFTFHPAVYTLTALLSKKFFLPWVSPFKFTNLLFKITQSVVLPPLSVFLFSTSVYHLFVLLLPMLDYYFCPCHIFPTVSQPLPISTQTPPNLLLTSSHTCKWMAHINSMFVCFVSK